MQSRTRSAVAPGDVWTFSALDQRPAPPGAVRRLDADAPIANAGSGHSLPHGELLAPLVDELDDRLNRAERTFEAQWAADTKEVLGHELQMPTVGEIERIQVAVRGETAAERRLLVALARARVDRGVGAVHAARMATLAVEQGAHADELGAVLTLVAASVLGASGLTELAERLFSDLAAGAERRGASATYALAVGQRGVERFRRGDLEGALTDLEEAVGTSLGKPWEMIVDDGRAHLLRTYVECGRSDDAEKALSAWHAVGPLPNTPFANRLLIERGRVRLTQSRYREAVEDLELVAVRLGGQIDSALFEWRDVAAMAHQRLGQGQAALTLAADEYERAEAWGGVRRLGVATMTLGAIDGGEAGVRRLRKAVSILASSSSRLELARATIELGSALRRQGMTREARRELSAGANLARSCGAVRLVALVDHELAATRRRPARQAPRWGVEALTPSERRVADLAARGLSNRDIAATLVVTTKTVEMHLARTYRKLDIRSRQHLGTALGTQRPQLI
jgi:DNA-binding NarL/FixJ family response regulator